MLKCLVKIMIKPIYLLISLTTSLLFWVIYILFSKISIISFIFRSGIFDPIKKTKIILSFFTSFGGSLSLFHQIIMLVIFFLAGINISLLIYSLKLKLKMHRLAGVSFIGALFGFLGIGCLSCGTALISTFLSLSIAAGIIKFLPLHGLEFGIIGIIIILISTYFTLKNISQSSLCKINNK